MSEISVARIFERFLPKRITLNNHFVIIELLRHGGVNATFLSLFCAAIRNAQRIRCARLVCTRESHDAAKHVHRQSLGLFAAPYAKKYGILSERKML